MANLDGQLWKYNLARITLVDVTEDYVNFLQPMPSDMYPVVSEVYLPKYKLLDRIIDENLLSGFYYDWHETGETEEDIESHWYVGVVSREIV